MLVTPARATVLTALVTTLIMLAPAAAQDADTAVDGATTSTAPAIVLPPATSPVYLVPYMRGGDGSATVVSITNLGTGSCATSVDWKVGVGTAACRTVLIHGGGSPVGDTLDHCTNANVVGCNAICPQPAPFGFRAEGAAIVGAQSTCKTRIAVDARIYYFNSTGEVSGVADLKVIKLPAANKGE